MKKVCFGMAAACMLAGLTGCVSQANRMAMHAPVLDGMKTTATYDILGDAKGTSTGKVLFGFISIGGEAKKGQDGVAVSPFPFAGSSPVEAAAIYNAIESVPTADALIATRMSKEVKNYIVYKEETVTVKGKAVRYNTSAK